ncbi:hypothetical protein GUITHDRAFT_148475 [Guillardia theta CCMP2712]|uniref:Uncharacterized protein n=1 Tax=Guillardia theta (strain CCMP2712) TaxID=905079 RepID=L1I8Q6_GUITC|nr:hypothetical protein GUITHDRAFT_148475 [Guillardia theta CCMP2712]EKX32651.1 hypothetical protein GUITHDRAFT_148475 [Guillardia theta CCMP2712]|eukprot:XP_005819631.1 hypothetical protein GUITHDRAFT_148475 [Guillardia theta CCMP2712]
MSQADASGHLKSGSKPSRGRNELELKEDGDCSSTPVGAPLLDEELKATSECLRLVRARVQKAEALASFYATAQAEAQAFIVAALWETDPRRVRAALKELEAIVSQAPSTSPYATPRHSDGRVPVRPHGEDGSDDEDVELLRAVEMLSHGRGIVRDTSLFLTEQLASFGSPAPSRPEVG